MLHRFFHFLKQSLLVVLCILLLGGLLAGGWFFYQGRQLYRSAASSYQVCPNRRQAAPLRWWRY